MLNYVKSNKSDTERQMLPDPNSYVGSLRT
jgi:hypothetical protein